MATSSSAKHQSAPAHARKPIKVLLYTLFTSENQLQRVYRSRSDHWRNRIGRIAHLTNWNFTGRWQAPHWIFEDVTNSNLGDVAVRLGVSKALKEAFAGNALEIVEVPWGKLTADFLNHNRFDLIVFGGGGYLFVDPNGKLPQRFLDDLEALQIASCPVVATSIGINQLLQSSASPPFVLAADQLDGVRRFAKALALVSVRDALTSNAIGSVGVHPHQ